MSTEQTENTSALITLGTQGQTVADQAEDIRGRKVQDGSGAEIGKIKGLLIDTEDRKVRFLEVEHGGFFGLGAKTSFLPVDAISKVGDHVVSIHQSGEHVAAAPLYDPDLQDKPSYYDDLSGYYGYQPYWSMGYVYPGYPYYGNGLHQGGGAFQPGGLSNPEVGIVTKIGAADNGLGLPAGIRACLFDLDGVLTDTAKVHAAAWQEMFDDFLEARATSTATTFVAFDPVADYDRYVDGKERADGTASFLSSRGIDLPQGHHGAPTDSPTITGLGEIKNAIFVRRIRSDGVEPYAGSVRYVMAVRAVGLRTAVVSSSANCAEVLEAAGITALFDARIDGISIDQQQLAGKPAPDAYLAAAVVLGVEPSQAAVFEDALAGVAAGRAGAFGFVVGVDRVGQAAGLRSHGADRVVTDLGQLLYPVGPT